MKKANAQDDEITDKAKAILSGDRGAQLAEPSEVAALKAKLCDMQTELMNTPEGPAREAMRQNVAKLNDEFFQKALIIRQESIGKKKRQEHLAIFPDQEDLNAKRREPPAQQLQTVKSKVGTPRTKAAPTEPDAQIQKMEDEAVVKIQSFFRGQGGRQRAVQEMEFQMEKMMDESFETALASQRSSARGMPRNRREEYEIDDENDAATLQDQAKGEDQDTGTVKALKRQQKPSTPRTKAAPTEPESPPSFFSRSNSVAAAEAEAAALNSEIRNMQREIMTTPAGPQRDAKKEKLARLDDEVDRKAAKVRQKAESKEDEEFSEEAKRIDKLNLELNSIQRQLLGTPAGPARDELKQKIAVADAEIMEETEQVRQKSVKRKKRRDPVWEMSEPSMESQVAKKEVADEEEDVPLAAVPRFGGPARPSQPETEPQGCVMKGPASEYEVDALNDELRTLQRQGMSLAKGPERDAVKAQIAALDDEIEAKSDSVRQRTVAKKSREQVHVELEKEDKVVAKEERKLDKLNMKLSELQRKLLETPAGPKRDSMKKAIYDIDDGLMERTESVRSKSVTRKKRRQSLDMAEADDSAASANVLSQAVAAEKAAQEAEEVIAEQKERLEEMPEGPAKQGKRDILKAEEAKAARAAKTAAKMNEAVKAEEKKAEAEAQNFEAQRATAQAGQKRARAEAKALEEQKAAAKAAEEKAKEEARAREEQKAAMKAAEEKAKEEAKAREEQKAAMKAAEEKAKEEARALAEQKAAMKVAEEKAKEEARDIAEQKAAMKAAVEKGKEEARDIGAQTAALKAMPESAEKKEAERKVKEAAERAEQEKAAQAEKARQLKKAEEKAEQEKAAQAEKARQLKKAEEKAEQEKAAQAEKARQLKKAEEKAKQEGNKRAAEQRKLKEAEAVAAKAKAANAAAQKKFKAAEAKAAQVQAVRAEAQRKEKETKAENAREAQAKMKAKIDAEVNKPIERLSMAPDLSKRQVVELGDRVSEMVSSLQNKLQEGVNESTHPFSQLMAHTGIEDLRVAIVGRDLLTQSVAVKLVQCGVKSLLISESWSSSGTTANNLAPDLVAWKEALLAISLAKSQIEINDAPFSSTFAAEVDLVIANASSDNANNAIDELCSVNSIPWVMTSYNEEAGSASYQFFVIGVSPIDVYDVIAAPFKRRMSSQTGLDAAVVATSLSTTSVLGSMLAQSVIMYWLGMSNAHGYVWFSPIFDKLSCVQLAAIRQGT